MRERLTPEGHPQESLLLTEFVRARGAGILWDSVRNQTRICPGFVREWSLSTVPNSAPARSHPL